MKLSAKFSFLGLAVAFAFIGAGCETTGEGLGNGKDTKFAPIPPASGLSVSNDPTALPTPIAIRNKPVNVEEIILREGDVVKVGVPSTPSLTGPHVIRRDGNITLDMVGDIRAAGKNLTALKADLLSAYSSKIDTKEITVELESGKFPIFVTGAVIRPGKVESDHPMTALEAVMESGGFDFGHANMKSVKVSRLENGKYKSFIINLKSELEGHTTDPFFLKPQDIVYVPERFVWF